ncbi:MAG: N-acetylmannosaminyltransferase [Clostridiales bacterium GWE2_32_10]|nr:MAG: N-acetylmannosaminyltransferase [Clostridiales bacterium GWE2_32_10]
MDKVNILGVNIDKVTMNEAINRVMGFLDSDKLNTVYTPNPEFIMNARDDEEFKKILNEGDLVIPDGIGVVYASRILGNPVSERVPGYELTENILKGIKDKKYTAYFLGSKGDTAKLAAENMMQKYTGLKVAGYRDGYFKVEEEERIIDEINRLEVDYLVVGLGSPKQEQFIYRNKQKLKVKVAIGNGGTLDIMAGKVKRAPVIFQKLGLEWLYRLLKEPTRFKRMLKLPQFMWIVIMTKNKEQRTKNKV